MGLAVLTGAESPEKAAEAAYAMEKGLKEMYLALAEMAIDEDVSLLCSNLAGYESKHMDGLWEILTELGVSVDRESFDQGIAGDFIEGGYGAREFLELNKEAAGSTIGILELAMSVETQALDLYLRFADQEMPEKTKSIIYRTAEEEKSHLKALGELMGRKV